MDDRSPKILERMIMKKSNILRALFKILFLLHCKCVTCHVDMIFTAAQNLVTDLEERSGNKSLFCLFPLTVYLVFVSNYWSERRCADGV